MNSILNKYALFKKKKKKKEKMASIRLSFKQNLRLNTGFPERYKTDRNHCVKSVQIRSFFWSVFSRIRTEYGEIRSISPYSVRMRENTDQKKFRIWTLFTQ